MNIRLRPLRRQRRVGAELRRDGTVLPPAGRDWERLRDDKGALDLWRYSKPLRCWICCAVSHFVAIWTSPPLMHCAISNARLKTRSGSQRHGDNVKLGKGGIREVEFVQMFQLIHGGRDRECSRRLWLICYPR